MKFSSFCCSNCMILKFLLDSMDLGLRGSWLIGFWRFRWPIYGLIISANGCESFASFFCMINFEDFVGPSGFGDWGVVDWQNFEDCWSFRLIILADGCEISDFLLQELYNFEVLFGTQLIRDWGVVDWLFGELNCEYFCCNQFLCKIENV